MIGNTTSAEMRTTFSAIVIALTLTAGASGQSAPDAPGQWRSYGGDPGGTRYSPLQQINTTNITRLKRVWTFHTGEVSPNELNSEKHPVPSFECTPLEVDGVLYVSTPGQRVLALDAETGKQIWVFDAHEGKSGPRRLMQHRGVAYWEGAGSDGKGIESRILFGTLDGRLIALDAHTGKVCPGFGNNGEVNLRKGVADQWPDRDYSVTSPPAIYQDRVIVGAQLQEYPSLGPSGAVRAFDVRTGRLVWKFDTVPGPGEPGHETWEGGSWKDRSGTNVWSLMSVDVKRGMVFLPIGSPSYDFYGADRQGQDLFGNSLVALDAASGKLIWYFQMVHHDLWDYDLPAQPVLVTLRRNGREVPAVVQVTKMGLVFVLDRLTGKPLFPVEERPVPPSLVPGEASWPTQPFPLKPPALSRTSLTIAEVTAVTPDSRRYCLEAFASILRNKSPSDVIGRIYNPLGTDLTLAIPGTLGGATWSGGSFDPSSRYLYVNTNEAAAVGLMKPQSPGSPERYRRASPWGEYARFWDDHHYPCQRPPWGTLNAVDLNSGEIAWKVPLGVVDELAAKGIQTGTSNIGGSMVTAGGLVFIAASNDSRFRAFDARTGRVLWETQLEASGHATPITFMGKRTHKQFVVIAAGGGGYFSSKVSDTLDGYALTD